MKEIVEKLQEQRKIKLAKEVLESKGYKVMKESSEDTYYWAITIEASTNAPGTSYHEGGKRVTAGESILQAAGLSGSGIEVDCFGYDDITFVVKSDDKRYVDRVARKIAAHTEEPSDGYRDEYEIDDGDVLMIAGPYPTEELEEDGTTEVDYWSR